MSQGESFKGYPKDGLKFFADVAENNNREWFQENKGRYQQNILTPSQDFVVELGDRLRLLSEGIVADSRTSGSGSIMRIYRDVRFSRDKSPYKTHLGIVFWEGSRKKSENPGYYFHLEALEAVMYNGMYRFPKDYLHAYREAVIDDGLGSDLKAVLKHLNDHGNFEIGGSHYKRVPREYDPEHPRAALLKFNGLWAKSPTIDKATITSPNLIDVCFEYCETMYPLHEWLVRVDRLATEA